MKRTWLPFLLVLAPACASSRETKADAGVWLKGTPALQERIDEEAARLPWTHDVERVELIHWFAGVGEPAYDTLLELARDDRQDVAGSALAAIGATGDRRLLEHVQALPEANEGGSAGYELERARALLRLGDWSAIPTLIEGMRSEFRWTRALSAQTLYESTRERFGFDPNGSEESRAAAIVKWEEWWQRRASDWLLKK